MVFSRVGRGYTSADFRFNVLGPSNLNCKPVGCAGFRTQLAPWPFLLLFSTMSCTCSLHQAIWAFILSFSSFTVADCVGHGAGCGGHMYNMAVFTGIRVIQSTVVTVQF